MRPSIHYRCLVSQWRKVNFEIHLDVSFQLNQSCCILINLLHLGTGVVTSVPSDAPDDYTALKDLQEKEALREKYGITKEMVDYDVVEIIEIPGMGRRAAVDICLAKKIKSQNDKVLLAEAKEEVYKKGFYEGVMLMGSQKGEKVCDAKMKVRDELLSVGLALSYYEPERKVISRSGDDCVIALCNQVRHYISPSTHIFSLYTTFSF